MPGLNDLWNIVGQFIEQYGIDGAVKRLNASLSQEVKFDNDDVELVLVTISEKLNIPVAEIIFGNGRKNERKYAIGFCAFYLRNHFHYPTEQIIAFLKKDESICHKYTRLISQLNPHHSHDKKYCELKKEFDTLLPKKSKK